MFCDNCVEKRCALRIPNTVCNSVPILQSREMGNALAKQQTRTKTEGRPRLRRNGTITSKLHSSYGKVRDGKSRRKGDGERRERRSGRRSGNGTRLPIGHPTRRRTRRTVRSRSKEELNRTAEEPDFKRGTGQDKQRRQRKIKEVDILSTHSGAYERFRTTDN